MSDVDDDQQDSGGSFASPRFLGAAVVVALIAVAGLVIAVTTLFGGDDDPEPVTTPQPTTADSTTPTPTASESSDPEASRCGLEGFEETGTVAEAPETRWSVLGQTDDGGDVLAPGNDRSGPGVQEPAGGRYCFAHTPEGALMAAANVAVMTDYFPTFPSIKENSLAAGEGQENFDPTLPPGPSAAPIVGFRLLSYSASAASIDIAIRVDSELYRVVYDLVWERGDWRVRAGPDGGLLTPPAEIPDLAGFLAWTA